MESCSFFYPNDIFGSAGKICGKTEFLECLLCQSTSSDGSLRVSNHTSISRTVWSVEQQLHKRLIGIILSASIASYVYNEIGTSREQIFASTLLRPFLCVVARGETNKPRIVVNLAGHRLWMILVHQRPIFYSFPRVFRIIFIDLFIPKNEEMEISEPSYVGTNSILQSPSLLLNVFDERLLEPLGEMIIFFMPYLFLILFVSSLLQ